MAHRTKSRVLGWIVGNLISLIHGMHQQAVGRYRSLSTIHTSQVTDSTRTGRDSRPEITVTEVWPDQFELAFNANCGEVPIAATYTIDRTHLQALRQQINQALH